MKKQIEITLYSFDELEGKAKERAIQYHNEHFMCDEWWGSTYDMMKEEGEHKHGFRVNDIRFSGFWSQGDGASWCGAVDLGDWVRKTFNSADLEHPLTQIFLALLDEGWIESKVMVSFNSSHYCHENTMHVNTIDHYYKIDDDSVMETGMFKGANVAELIHLIESTLDTLYERLVEECKDFARTIYKELEADYEAQTSEDAIGEAYAINDVWFYETGAIA